MSEHLGDYGDYGEVSLFGLDEFGQPVGMSQFLGAVIGAGVSNGVAIGVRALKQDWAKYSEVIGLGAGIISGGAMYAMGEGTRAAGIAAASASVLSCGLRALEQLVYKMTGSSVPGLGVPMVEQLGMPSVEQLRGFGAPPQLMGANSLGIPTIEPTPAVAGTQISAAPPVNLMGPLPANAAHIQTINGPDVSGLAMNYGATLFGNQ